jgi:hypothetical protein
MSLSDVSFPPVRPLSVPAAAVGVTITPQGFLHAVIFYASPQKTVFQCELTLGGTVVVQPVKASWKFAWTIPPLDLLILEQLADLCETVKASKQRVPYGFKYTPTTFSTGTGTLRIGGDSIGLTCATFVMAMFLSVNVDLIDHQRWGARADDARWQEDVWIFAYQNGSCFGIPQHELDTNLAHLPCLRYRPEEVVAAARFPKKRHPITIDTAAPLGAELVAALKAS